MSDFLILDEENNNKHEPNKQHLQTEDVMTRINDFLYGFQKIKTKEKVIFYRLLSTMTNAWMSLIKSIEVLEKQEKNPLFKKILNSFINRLREWDTLSDCLEGYPSNFAEAEVWIVKSGEKTGQLNYALTTLADQIEKVDSISGKIKAAMIYPGFIMLVVVAVVAIMMIKVVPGLLDIFPSKDDLPGTTLTLIAISDAFVAYWIHMLVWAFLFYVGLFFWKRTDIWKYMYDDFMLKIPIFGSIQSKLVLSKFSRIFSWLLWSGVSILETLKITSAAVGNEVYKQRILLLTEDVSKWIKIWESLDSDKLFPEMMVQMIQVWEETAKLDQTILKVADFYDEEIDNIVAILHKLLEPFIIVTLAVVVGFIAIAIMQPIMWLADTIT